MNLNLSNGFGLLHGVGSFFAMDIGTTALRLVQLSGDLQHGWTLEKFAYVPVDPKVLRDDSETGQRRLGEIVLGAVKQAGITTKNVALGMPAGKTYTAIVEVDSQDEKDLAKTMRFQLDKYTPMAVDEAEVDYALLGPSPNDATKMEVLVTSTSKTNAEALLEKVEGWGLNVIAQELCAHGFDLHYFNSKREGEVDFVVQRARKVTLIEVKSGDDWKRHRALENVLDVAEWGLGHACVLCKGNVERAGKITYLPLYMSMFLSRPSVPAGLTFEVDLGALDV